LKKHFKLLKKSWGKFADVLGKHQVVLENREDIFQRLKTHVTHSTSIAIL
jgi:hypothetical protein